MYTWVRCLTEYFSRMRQMLVKAVITTFLYSISCESKAIVSFSSYCLGSIELYISEVIAGLTS